MSSTIRENIILALQARNGWFKFLSRQEQDKIAHRYIELLGIVTPSADQLVKNLSGGNQQKVILARWLATNPDVLILDEPTRGIDVGAKAEIQKLVLELAAEGKSIVFISSELEEVLRTSQRVIVLRDHRKVAEFTGDVDDQTVIQAMAGTALVMSGSCTPLSLLPGWHTLGRRACGSIPPAAGKRGIQVCPRPGARRQADACAAPTRTQGMQEHSACGG